MPDGMGMPGMPGMGNMFPSVKHTKVDQLKSNLPIITITTDTALNAQKLAQQHLTATVAKTLSAKLLTML